MSYKHLSRIMEVEVAFETAAQRGIFIQCCYSSDKSGRVRMPQGEIALQTLYSLATVKRQFVRLQELGLLEKGKHGHYQIIVPDEENEGQKPTPLRAKLRHWLRGEWGEAEEGMIITILDDGEFPEFFDDAVLEGYLEQVQEGQVKGQPAADYKVHLSPSVESD